MVRLDGPRKSEPSSRVSSDIFIKVQPERPLVCRSATQCGRFYSHCRQNRTNSVKYHFNGR